MMPLQNQARKLHTLKTVSMRVNTLVETPHAEEVLVFTSVAVV